MGLDGVELIMAIEDTFGIAIEDEEASQTRTVGELNDLIVSKLSTRSGRQVASDEVWKALCQLIVKRLGVRRDEITRDAAIVDDLGID